MVTNTPDVLTDSTADLTWALLLAVARRVVEGDRWIRTGTWPGWAPTQMIGSDVSGKTLGIVGMGRIGQAVAQRGAVFRMPVIYAGRRRVPAPLDLPWEWQPLDAVLAKSDVLSLHVPLTDMTRHLIGPRELTLMKPTAYLVNTSRGPVIDEAALVSALCAGCDLGLFTSDMKFDSGTGGPCFFTFIPGRLGTKTDFKLIYPRTEYHCIRCAGHQGHVFDDGPPPRGKRYCNIGLALRFIPA